MEGTRTYTTGSNPNPVRTCSVHGEECTLYCSFDKMDICNECSLTTHCDHSTLPLQAEAIRIRADMQLLKANLQELIYGTSRNVPSPAEAIETENSQMTENRSSNCSACSPCPSTEIRAMIQNDFASMRMELNRCEAKILGYLNDLEDTAGQLQRHEHDLYTTQAMTSSEYVLDRISKVESINNDIQFLRESSVVLKLADGVKELWHELSKPRKGHLKAYYTPPNVNLYCKALSSSQLTNKEVVPYMCLCEIDTPKIGFKEGHEFTASVILKDYLGYTCVGHDTDHISFFSVVLRDIQSRIPISADRIHFVFYVEPYGDGSYGIHCNISRRGTYEICFYYNDRLLAGKSFSVIIQPKLNWAFGTKGSSNGEFKPPWGLVVDKRNNRLYVSDCGNARIQVFDSHNGAFIRTIGRFGTDASELRSPRGLCYSRRGLLYVADAGNKRVQVYDPVSGAHVKALYAHNRDGYSLLGPWGVVEGADDTLYVSDMNGHSVVQMNPQGELINLIGNVGSGPGQLLYPRGLCVSDTGLLYVSDCSNYRIQVFQCLDGTYINEIPGYMAMDISMGPENALCISDFENSQVLLLDHCGILLETLLYPGSSLLGMVKNPCGVCYAGKYLYVADAGNYRIQIINV